MAKVKPNPAALVSSLKQTTGESRLLALATDQGEKEVLPQKVDHNEERPSAETITPSPVIPVAVRGNEGKLREGAIYAVPLDDLVEGPWNARKFYIKSRVDEIAADMKEAGQRVPANVYYDDHGRLVIDDGRYRFRAARQAGIPTLKVQVIPAPKTPIEAYKRSRSSNRFRNDQSILDDAFRLKDLSEALGSSQRALGKEIGYDDGEASKLMALTKLPENIVLTVMSDAKLLTLRFLYNLSIFFDRKGEKAALQLAAEAVEQGMSARELEARLRHAERGYREKPRSERIPLEKGSVKGFVKTFPTGRLELKLEGLDADEQMMIFQKLRAVLE